MPLVAPEDFNKSMLPGTFKKETKELIELAVMAGWTIHIATNQTVSIAAPPPSVKKYHFGVSGRQIGSRSRVIKDIIKHGDPEKVALMAGAVSGDLDPRSLAWLPAVGDPGTIVATPEPEEKPVPVLVTRNDEPEVVAGVTIPDAHIVSVKPMLVGRGKSKAYESETTFVRKWSDGTSDYACRYPECDFTSAADRLSVSRHYSNIHSTGVAEKPPVFKAEVTDKAQYAPRKTRVEALAAHLLEAMESGKPLAEIAEEVARESLVWVGTQSKAGTEFAAEREEMTPEETLQRIRTLLDRGEYIGMQQRQAELEDSLITMQAELDEAKATAVANAEKAEAARASLRTFLELGRDLVGDSE